MQFGEQAHHRLAVTRVEIAGGLIGEQDGRLAGHRPGHRHPLLLAARQLCGVMTRPLSHADSLEGALDVSVLLAGSHAAIRERQRDILSNRHVAQQVEALKDEADLAVACASALLSVSPATGCPFN